MNRLILQYRARIIAKRLAAPALSLLSPAPPDDAPEVTIFMSSLNTRDALELALRSLVQHTHYPNYQIWVGENASTDGSREMLDALDLGVPLRVIDSPHLSHAGWLDKVSRAVETPYWVTAHSDMLFLSDDWLTDLIAVLENDRDLHLLAASPTHKEENVVEPVSGNLVDLGEHLATWLFAMRTSLREQIDTSFGHYKGERNEKTGNVMSYDTGGRLMLDMRARGLRYGFMPWWYRFKYHHFGSLSWGVDGIEGEVKALRECQFRDIRRWASSLRQRTSAGEASYA